MGSGNPRRESISPCGNSIFTGKTFPVHLLYCKNFSKVSCPLGNIWPNLSSRALGRPSAATTYLVFYHFRRLTEGSQDWQHMK